MQPMTRDEIENRHKLGLPMPNMFTGKWGDAYFFKGRRWFGPTNLIGNFQGLRSHSNYKKNVFGDGSS